MVTLTKIKDNYFIEENSDFGIFQILLRVSEVKKTWMVPVGLVYKNFKTAEDVILSGKVKYL